jgi:hypothetical protein
MTVFVLIRADQNEHGYIDTSITGVFLEARIAKEIETLQRLAARGGGACNGGRRESRRRVAGVVEDRGTSRGLIYRSNAFFHRFRGLSNTTASGSNASGS